MTPAQLWPLALGAILNERNRDDHTILGGALRPRHAARATTILATGWDVRTPVEAKSALEWLFDEGHRTGYAEEDGSSEESFAAWDYCRAANVAGWSFVAYLLDRDTAWQAMLRAARLVQATYSSFAEMGASYRRGMRRWDGRGSAETERVRDSDAAFAKLLADPEGPYCHPWNTSLDDVPPPSIEQKTEEIAPGASILEAMDRVGSGGRIILAPGTYAESITPPHSLELVARGDGEVVLEAQGRPAVWAKSELRAGEPRPISVSVRGITLRAGRTADNKSLNAMTVVGGYLRIHDCQVDASHHGASVRDNGVLLATKSKIVAGQNGVWCEGGSVSVVDCELRDLGFHGAYMAKSPYTNVFEDTKIVAAKQVALVAEAELRVRRGAIEAPGVCGLSARAHVTMTNATITDSKGWGIAIENGGTLHLAKTTIDGSANASLDVKHGSVDTNGCVLSSGTTSGLIVQGNGRALLVDTRIEHHAQGNVYAIAGAELFAMRTTVRGKAAGVWLQNATATFIESAIESETTALDVRAGENVVLEKCVIRGGITLAANATARLAACEADGDQTLGEGANLETCTHEDVCEAVEAALASVQGAPQGPEPEEPPKPVYH